MSRTNSRQDSKKPSIDDYVRQAGQRRGKARLKTDFSYLEKDYPNKVFRVVNDTPGRIQDLMRDGWEPVQGAASDGTFQGSQANNRQDSNKPSGTSKDGVSYISIVVGQTPTGDAQMGYLMMIHEDIYNAIQKSKEEYLNDVDKAMSKGVTASSQGIGEKDSSQYAPNLPNGGVGMSSSVKAEL